MLRGDVTARDFKGQFSGHETFPIRYGWLKKVVDGINSTEPNGGRMISNPDIAMAHFGVGKNMVVSMKHWGLSTGILEVVSKTEIKITDLGIRIFSEKGFDPYLENPASLWLLHWRIAGSPFKSTTWYWAFNHYSGVTIDRESLASDITRLVQERGWKRISGATIRRDVDCFFRTYIVRHTKHGGVNEDSLECPLAELELIEPTATKGVYEFRRGPKPSLPDDVFNFALAEFWDRHGSAETLTVEMVTYEPGSPGRTFKLDERSVIERLSRIETTSDGIFRWSDTAGLQQVLRTTRQFKLLDFLHYADT